MPTGCRRMPATWSKKTRRNGFLYLIECEDRSLYYVQVGRRSQIDAECHLA